MVEAVEEGWVEVVMAEGVLEEAMVEGREAVEDRGGKESS